MRGLVVVDLARVDVALDQVEPVLVRLLDDLVREGDVVVAAADEGDDVAAARDLVVREPVLPRLDDAGAELLDVLERADVRGDGVLDVDGDDLPVSLAAVVGREGAEDLDLLDLADEANTGSAVSATCTG